MSDQRNTIRSWALAAVAVTSIAVIGAAAWLIDLLAAPDWCARAMGAAEDANARPEFAVNGCFELLRRQVDALAINSHIVLGTLALCLAVLVVIVLAGGRLSFKASKAGLETDIGQDRGDPKVEAARRVEEAATVERQTIEQEVEAAPPAAKPEGDDFERNTQ